RGFGEHGFESQCFESRCVGDPRSVRSCPLFHALDRCHQIFNKSAGECHFEYSSFLLRTRPCSLFSWPLRKNSTTELRPLHAERPRFPNSLPGTPYHRRTGSPAVSPSQLKLFRRGARGPPQSPPFRKRGALRGHNVSPARVFPPRGGGLRSISSPPAVTGFLVSSR